MGTYFTNPAGGFDKALYEEIFLLTSDKSISKQKIFDFIFESSLSLGISLIVRLIL